ncbi:MAG: glycosyltransferase [Bacteroidota bacterium]
MIPEVSVILPVRNAAGTIESAIQSIIDQTFSELELLVILDGSNQATRDIVKKYARGDRKVQVLEQPPKGIVNALTLGLSHAKGKFIARMDGDDISFPDRIEKQCAFLNESPKIDLVSCLVQHGGDASTQQGYLHYINWINELISPTAIRLNRFVESPLAHPSVMFRTASLATFGSYRKQEGPEDYELWLRWLQQGAHMAKVPEVLLLWNDPDTRLSRTHPAYAENAFLMTKAPYLNQELSNVNSNHPDVAVWGYGRRTRRKLEYLMNSGLAVNIQCYIDVKPPASGFSEAGIPVYNYQDSHTYTDQFILCMVNNRGVRASIREYLIGLNLTEGINFLMC